MEKANKQLFSTEYLEFIEKSGLTDLTNSQHWFAEWLLENKETVSKIGDMETIFIEVRKYLKN